jgi:hypothetical protein
MYQRNSLLTEQTRGFVLPGSISKNEACSIRDTLLRRQNCDSPLEREKVLSLTHYALKARIQPIFSLAGTDVRSYRESVGNLKESDESIAAYYKDRESSYIQNTLHPIQYLEQLADAEEIRLNFIQDPQSTLATKYHDKLVKTIDSYLAYTDSLLETLASIKATSSLNGNFIFTNGSITPEYIEYAIREYRKEIVKQKNEEQRRWNCYNGKTRSCDPILLPTVSIEVGPIVDSNTLIPQNVTINSEILRAYRASRSDGNFSKFTTAVINESACYKKDSPVFYSLWQKKSSGSTFLRPNILNDLFFVDARDGTQSTWDYFKKVREHGIRYFFQPLANNYMCTDLSFDLSLLSTLLHAASIIDSEQPLSTSSEISTEELRTDIEELHKLGAKIVNSNVLYEDSIRAYMSSLSHIFEKYSPDVLLKNFSRENILSAEKLLIVYNNKSASYDKLINFAVDNNLFVIDATLSGTRIEIEHLFYARGFPQLLLGGFNPSFVPQRTSFIADPANQKLLNSFVSYNDQLSKEYSPELLVTTMKKALEVETELRDR